ncbi:hypothetical protein D3C86_1825940 [compost metagenome]
MSFNIDVDWSTTIASKLAPTGGSGDAKTSFHALRPGLSYLRILFRLDARHPDSANHLSIENNRHATLKRSQQGCREESVAPGVDHVLIAFRFAPPEG